ncbi:calsenilin-like [Homarus americanus]|uniref:calsenilin-like n=1 Tax=Homarus americanus TaxID=6706 RepID=UPI001C473A88|nr:calsenilin-like [Homarus americanus]
MATPPDSPYGDFMMTFETVRPVKHKPVKLEELCKQTKFTRQEIRLMYRGFKQECPEGVVQEDAFKEIYAKFFPHGNSSLYAHHVFKAFDLNSNGQISFRDLLVSLSQLLRGTAYDKLKFAFKLYDVNGDGCITKAELTDIVSSVHELMGRSGHNRQVEDKQTREHVERLFKKLDLNGDGVVTIDEFIQSCMQDEVITESLKVFEGL